MTINIIKKWGDIGKNYLDTNLEYTNDPSQKISLDKALEKSKNLLPTDIQNVKEVFQAFSEIDNRISNKPYKLGGENLAFKIYEDLTKEIASNLAKKYSCQELSSYYIEFYQEKEQESLDPATIKKVDLSIRKLLERSYQLMLKEKIQTTAENRGIVYKIENEKRCCSYLIGSAHYPNLLNGSKLLEIVKNSSEFFWEYEVEIASLLPEHSLAEVPLDLALARIASREKIPIHGLDTEEELAIIFHTVDQEYSCLSMEDRQRKSDLEHEKIEKLGLIEKYKKFRPTPTLLDIELLDAWKRGDSEALQDLIKIEKAQYILSPEKEIKRRGAKIRNKKWLKNCDLVTKLHNAEKPISIVVGAFHLFGKTGLLKAYKDQGLKVQQI